MRPLSLVVLLLLCATTIDAGELICDAGPENDRRALALHQRTRARLASLAGPCTLMERNFALATGGRGRLITTFVRPGLTPT